MGTASLDKGAGSGESRLARGVIGWSPEPCSTVAGLPRLMIGVRLLLLAGPAVGTADITGMPDRAVVGGNRPPLGMQATPATHWERTIGSCAGWGCLGRQALVHHLSEVAGGVCDRCSRRVFRQGLH